MTGFSRKFKLLMAGVVMAVINLYLIFNSPAVWSEVMEWFPLLSSHKKASLSVSSLRTKADLSDYNSSKDSVHQPKTPHALLQPSAVVLGIQSAGISWKEFVRIPFEDSPKEAYRTKHARDGNTKRLASTQLFPAGGTTIGPLVTCADHISQKLAAPVLSQKDVDWCRWALSTTGGRVVVGKSWGKLSNRQEKDRFDALNCNSVASSNKNPSCDDSWGDANMKHWMGNRDDSIRCDAEKTSQIICSKNDNSDRICVFHNLQIDFNRYKFRKRPNPTPSKSFDANFLSGDCSDTRKTEENFPFHYLYSNQLSSSTCDYVHKGTVLLYSHDDIRNLGHTLNDILNMWVMLWYAQLARYVNYVTIMNIDSFKLGTYFLISFHFMSRLSVLLFLILLTLCVSDFLILFVLA